MRKWKDDLVPVLIEMMQDSTAAVKREVCHYSAVIISHTSNNLPLCL